MPLLSCANLHKTYRLGRVRVAVLRGVSMEVGEGECVAILGSSGSGKSTLLHLLGGLDRVDDSVDALTKCPRCGYALAGLTGFVCPECGSAVLDPASAGGAGAILFDGARVDRMSIQELDVYRRRDVGFVFQFYHLLPELTVLDNVRIAASVAAGVRRTDQSGVQSARELLEQVGLAHRLTHRPAELSGGERQRVAIARALVNRPRVLLADEPTGNLDQETGGKILDMLGELRRTHGHTMVVVTHDAETARRAERVVRLVDGRIATG